MSEATTTTIHTELDCKGLLCPLPVYQTAAAMKRLEPGQVLRVECTDPGSLEDFPAFARQQHHDLVGMEDRDGVQVFLIRKGGDR
ncbi:MAG: sulfurtransferase TusA family protein [Gemmatimonadota bacterium]